MKEKPRLTPSDYESLERSYISREIADQAGIYRVDSLDGRDLVGRKDGRDYNGLVFPYLRANGVVAHRLRLDHPPVDSHGKPEGKYLQAPGTRNRIYFPPGWESLAGDPRTPAIVSEGEKKCLALYHMALEISNGTGRPGFLALTFGGAWGYVGVTGKKTDANGQRIDEKGVIPDLDLLAWKGRRVTILYDANASVNPSVKHARRNLAAELTRRGAEVWMADLPPENGINGCDDYLAAHGVEALRKVLEAARAYDWTWHLLAGDKGPYAILENAILALRHAAEWAGVLSYNEFSRRVEARLETPWGFTGVWTDTADSLTAAWCQRSSIRIGTSVAAEAVQVVARDQSFHPVRDYLDGLAWDKQKRLDHWLTKYLGVKETPFSNAVGAKWMISAVARIYNPGCKADCMLIVDGPQGALKSTAFRALAEPYFSDDMPDLGTKDSQMATSGVWIIEMAELDAMKSNDWNRIKAFLSRQIDRFRPPYGRHLVETPRQSIFVGTGNHAIYFEDETGARRFWPVTNGEIQVADLKAARDQLWAEAVARYRAGESWWLDASLEEYAREEQELRYRDDSWQALVEKWLDARTNAKVSTADILMGPLEKPKGQWTRADEMRVARVLRRSGWKLASGWARPRLYIKEDL